MNLFRPAAALLATAIVAAAAAAEYQPSEVVPPSALREFRGVWVATVGNIDWPSKPGLTTAQQKTELLGILDRAAQLKLNAVLFQVRPACDALYASPFEPWSEYLTGTMGKAPQPFYDPLAFAVEEAHRRGLELHAWFNPYRALHFTSKSPIAPNHVSKTHPELVRRFGKYLWLDPGEPGVRDYTLKVVMDVVKRYDIDGVHFDDYFYPDRGDSGADSDFPDEASWGKYSAGAGAARLGREDWRRENVNQFVERAYDSIKAVKPWVKFGVSPRGIWRPGFPPQIKGLDAWATLYADSRKWLASGWVDYFTPQLYWPIESKEQNFGALLKWWSQQNTKGRLLWPGLNATRANQWRPDEIPDQIRRARNQPGVTGYVCYNASSLFQNDALSATLEQEINVQPALVPAQSWLHASAPAKPGMFLSGFTSGNLRLSMGKSSQESQSKWWLIQISSNGNWTSEILPGTTRVKLFVAERPDVIALTLIDRFGDASPACVIEKRLRAAPSAGDRDEHGAKN